MDTILRNGNIVLPGKGIVKGDIAIKNGKIAAVTEGPSKLEARHVIDAEGMHIFPGVIETHSHLGLAKGDEDLSTETGAAALGGVTTTLFFLRQPSPYEALYDHILSEAPKRCATDISFHIVLITEEHLESVPRYVEELGVTSFKLYLTYRGAEAKTGLYGGGMAPCPTLDDGYVLDCFRAIARYPKAMAIVHAEDIEIVNRAKNALLARNLDDMTAYALSRPPVAEAEGVRRALFFGREAGCRVNILHLTSHAGLNAFEEGKRLGGDCFAEVCHPYLMLGEEDVASTLFKVRPPLRPRADREALWQAVCEGKVETIGSDHVPRKRSEKEGSVWRPAAGLPGSQYLFLNMLREGHFKRGIPLERLAEQLSLRPARLYGMANKGDIRPGCDADLTVVDFNRSTVLSEEAFPSYSDYNVYEGQRAPAYIARTMVRGRTVALDGKLTGERAGRFIPRKGI